jgi:hypothetical protein
MQWRVNTAAAEQAAGADTASGEQDRGHFENCFVSTALPVYWAAQLSGRPLDGNHYSFTSFWSRAIVL